MYLMPRPVRGIVILGIHNRNLQISRRETCRIARKWVSVFVSPINFKEDQTVTHQPIPTPEAKAERRFISELELANRWNLSPKTLQRWRGIGRGPLFAKFSKKVGYPLDGQDGVLDWEQRILYRSTSERAFA